MERLIAIIGPTAVGKTAVSIDLAKQLHTEIISGDSMLVYKGMNIGTAKPAVSEQQGITHHLIDILEPSEEFNAVEFQQMATKCIHEINQKGKIPILAGGTGLYVKALLEGYIFNQQSGDQALRQHFMSLAEEHGNEYVHAMLREMDPEAAERLHANDIRRVIRALEVNMTEGKSVSQHKTFDGAGELMYDAVVIALTMERSTLYERINQRVQGMIARGLVSEVEALLQQGISPDCQAMQGIGYKEVVAYLTGQNDLPTAIDNIQKATRHFAKRQLTWYRKMPYIHWVHIDNFATYDKMFTYIYKYIMKQYNLNNK